MNKENIFPRNEKGEPHGYLEIYYNDGKLWYKGNYNNGNRVGYCEAYHPNGELLRKIYYIR